MRAVLRNVLLGCALALVGCRPKAPEAPPEPEPPPPSVPAALSEPPPPPLATTGSWAPLLRIVPEAELVAGADVAVLRRSPVWSGLVDQAATSFNPSGPGTVEAAGVCGIRLSDLRRVVFARQQDKPDAGSLMVLEAPGIGEPSRIDCIVASAKIPDAAWQGAKLVVEAGATHIIPLSSDVVALVDAPWVPEVEAAIVSGRAEAHQGVVVLTDRADLNAGLWVVGKDSAMSGTFAAVREFAATGDTSNGLRLSVWLGILPGQVHEVRTALHTQIDNFKTLPIFGGVAQSVSMTEVGDGLLVQASITEADLQALLDQLKGMM